MDVTNGRKLIKEHQIKTGVRLSFTAWLLKCIGHAVNEHKDVHSMMKGKKQIVTFDEVDISITIEKKTNGKKVPMALIIRKTNEKER